MKNMKKLSLLFLFVLIGSSLTAYAESEDLESKYYEGKTYIHKIRYQSEDENQKKNFEQSISVDGKKFKLSHVKYKVHGKNPVEEVVIHKEEKEVFENQEFTPQQTLQKDGITYQISDITETKMEPYRQKVSTYNEYQYYVTNESVPNTKNVMAKNQKSGKEENVSCKLQKVYKKGDTWVDSYIDIRFQDYDSLVFHWNGMDIVNNQTSEPLKGYESQLLESVNLNASSGKVLRTYWVSDPYTENNTVYRKARADISKKVPVYKAEYVGEISTPMTKKSISYIGKKESTTDFIYDIEAKAIYERDFSDMVKYIGIGILIVILLVVFILFLLAKKRKEKKE